MYVCNVGIACGARMGDVCEEKDLPFFVDDVLDAIEYALGDAHTEWGAKRIAAGHSKPFPLKYIEMGNENSSSKMYGDRFNVFYKAIKEKYPQLTLISNMGLGYKSNGNPNRKTDLVDPHFFRTADFFFRKPQLFDAEARDDHKVYVGEYACNRGVDGGNMLAALSEAVFISGMERNGDLVTMSSYAPLLENRNDREWPVNMIWISTDSVVGRSSYYVQKMYAENRPAYNLPTGLVQTDTEREPEKLSEGAVGFGITQTEYKDIRLTTADNRQVATDTNLWEPANNNMNVLKDFTGDNFTLEMKARQLSGKEGFVICFGLFHQPIDLKRYDGWMLNIGNRDNKSITLKKLEKGFVGWSAWEDGSLAQNIETGKWYDIRLEVKPYQVELWVDGVSVYKYAHYAASRNFAIAGYDEKSKEVIVKVVNARETPFQSKINLNGIKEVSPNGRVITLSADNLTDENSFAEPLKITPKEETYYQFGTSFDYTFKPNSFTIFRFKTHD
jgi:alpha-L-arabinofuranosidase